MGSSIVFMTHSTDQETGNCSKYTPLGLILNWRLQLEFIRPFKILSLQSTFGLMFKLKFKSDLSKSN